jgi:hypothetical protein
VTPQSPSASIVIFSVLIIALSPNGLAVEAASAHNCAAWASEQEAGHVMRSLIWRRGVENVPVSAIEFAAAA